MRYAWDLTYEYLRSMKSLKLIFAKIILHYMRIWDFISANRVDFFIANSRHVARRIKKLYGRDSVVIYPPVDVGNFEVCKEKDDFYVTVSRLVSYKKVDLIVEAFSKTDKKLLVIGDGPERKNIEKIAGDNVKILSYQPFEKLRFYLKKAKAFVFAANEDFGISLVEAQACGTPVIAFGKGGAKEIVIEGKTGLFFYKQDPDDIIEAVEKFEKMRFDPFELRKNAERFSKERFKREFLDYVKSIT